MRLQIEKSVILNKARLMAVETMVEFLAVFPCLLKTDLQNIATFS